MTSDGDIKSDYVTVDDLRKVLEIFKSVQAQIDSLQKQINIVNDGLQKQINLMVGVTVAESKTGLQHLHEEALKKD